MDHCHFNPINPTSIIDLMDKDFLRLLTQSGTQNQHRSGHRKRRPRLPNNMTVTPISNDAASSPRASVKGEDVQNLNMAINVQTFTRIMTAHRENEARKIPNQDLAAQMAKSEQENQIPLVDGVKVIHIEKARRQDSHPTSRVEDSDNESDRP